MKESSKLIFRCCWLNLQDKFSGKCILVSIAKLMEKLIVFCFMHVPTEGFFVFKPFILISIWIPGTF